MRQVTRFVVPAVAAIALLTFASTAQASEPENPFWQPVFDFFRFFSWF